MHSLFVPPAPYPGSKTKRPLVARVQSLGSQIEALPAAVYETDAWKPPLPGMPLFIMSPDAIREVLVERPEDFSSGDLFARVMRPAWGEGLLLSQGESWRFQRHAAAQAFRPRDIAALVPFFVTATQRRLEDWRTIKSQRFDLFEEMKRITFDIMIDTMLSGAQTIDRSTVQSLVHSFFADINRMRLSYVLWPDRYHANRPSIESVHRAPLMDYLELLVSERMQSAPRGDLIGLLLNARDPQTGNPLSHGQLCDNLLGFILAGYETTAVGLTWTIFLASQHPPTEASIREELNSAAANSDVTAQSMEQLVMVRQVISESLRLYPPAFMLTRISLNDCELAGHLVKSGQRINIPIYAIHRRKSVWSEPNSFQPNRFAPDAPKPDRYAYMPFGAGPRICIGAAFALSEMTAVIATLLSQVKIIPLHPEQVWPQTGLALQPRGGIASRIEWVH